MGLIRGIRLVNAISDGTVTGAALETALTTGGLLGDWQRIMQLRGQSRAIANTETAMNAVAASTTAMNAVAASTTAMNAVIASTTARTAVWASDTALTAIAGSSTAIAALRAASTYVVNGTDTVSAVGTSSLSGDFILVGWSQGAAAQRVDITAGRRSGSTVGNLSNASLPQGTTASTNNIMALRSPISVQIFSTNTTVYLGVLPV